MALIIISEADHFRRCTGRSWTSDEDFTELPSCQILANQNTVSRGRTPMKMSGDQQ